MISATEPVIIDIYKKLAELQRLQLKNAKADRPGGIGCIVYRNTAQAITGADVLSWNTVKLDTTGGEMWSNAASGRLVAPMPGLYVFGGGWAMEASQITASNARIAMYLAHYNSAVTLQGSYDGQITFTVNGKDTRQSAVGGAYMNVGDFINVPISHDFGVSKNIYPATATSLLTNYGWLFKVG